MTTCRDRLAGPYVAARLGRDLPGPYCCSEPLLHDGAHRCSPRPGVRVWWWTWGGGRLQVRARVEAA